MDYFCAFLKSRLAGKLPGISAQWKMAPLGEEKRLARLPERALYHKNAVLLLLTQIAGDDSCRILLTLRSRHMPTHKGQICLPGGKIKAGESEVDAAIRETHEEVGITPDQFEVVGKLTDLYIPNSRNCLYPIVACTGKLPATRPDRREVEEAFFTGLDELDDPSALKKGNWIIREKEFQVPFWQIHKTTPLWGATAMILSELLELYREYRTLRTTEDI